MSLATYERFFDRTATALMVVMSLVLGGAVSMIGL